MSCIYDQLRILYENELYSNVVTLGNLVLSSNEHVPDSLVVPAKVQSYSWYADSLVHTGQYRKAEQVFKKLQQTKKAVLKSKGICNNSATISKPPSPTLTESQIDANIRFQVHLCQIQLRQHHQALSTLQSIPAKQRTPRINMALGKLLQDGVNSRGAIAAYKEVLKECPLALEAAEGLLKLGVKGIEVNSLMLEGNPNYNVDWLNGWIKALSHFHAQEYTQAIAAFRQLDERTSLRDNVNILVPLGECYYYNGDNTNAMLVLQRAHAMEPLQRGLDILASILARERQIRELQRLVAPLQAPAELQGPEPWIALAYSLHAANKFNKALYLAQKACYISPRNIEGLLLKGQILLELKRYSDAVSHFREAQQVCSHRYETHKGLVDCYIGMHRFREALTIAASAVKQLGQTPRSLTLYAAVLMKDPLTVSKAKTLLKKALTLDKLFLPAVYHLAEIYEQEMTLESAISLLEKQVELRPTCKLHQMLADLLARVHEEEKALEHYSKALKLDPNNRRALEGMDRIDHSSSKLDSSYYMPGTEDENADATYDVGGEGTADSDNDNDADGSETEGVWSDIDVNLAQ